MDWFACAINHDKGADSRFAILDVIKGNVGNVTEGNEVEDVLLFGSFFGLLQFFSLAPELLFWRSTSDLK